MTGGWANKVSARNIPEIRDFTTSMLAELGEKMPPWFLEMLDYWEGEPSKTLTYADFPIGKQGQTCLTFNNGL
jgi:hypothetical protein